MDSQNVEKMVGLVQPQASILPPSELNGKSRQRDTRATRRHSSFRERSRRQAKNSLYEVIVNGGARSAAMTDLYDFPSPPGRLLQECFHLTPAETRLARIIARGEPLECAAQALGIKLPTARSQLAAVFAKTNTRRQPQLVALLSHLAHLWSFTIEASPVRGGA